MPSEQLALVIMAGGRSQRFGVQDKLQADLNGLPLGLHAAARLAPLGWAQRLAVARAPLDGNLSELGFRCLRPAADSGLGDNLALAAEAFGDIAGALILLADMPFVTQAHVDQMMAAATSPANIVCSLSKGVRSPPVLIGRDHFPALRALSGDEGAKTLFKAPGTNLIEIAANDEVTVDIDTVDALARWQRKGVAD